MIKNVSIVGLLSFICSLAIGQILVEPTTTKESAIPITTIEWHEPSFEFGEIAEGEKIKNVFTFTNTGKEPLVITNAKGSCGCTVPMWPKEPILPGATAELLVQFDSKNKGKEGGQFQSKRVSITANTDPVISYLTIKGKVFKEPKQEIVFKKEAKKEEIKQAKKLAAQNMDVDSDKVLLYPNPTDGELRVNIQDYENVSGSIEIFNSTGARVMEKDVQDFGDEQLINVVDYLPGIYTVSIKIEGKNRIAKRFVVPQK